MAKLSDAMVKGLRSVVANGGTVVPARTIKALQSRFLIKGSEDTGYEVTPSGRAALAELERRERMARESAERLSRPVPAQIGEPSAARPLVLETDAGNGCDCDQDGCGVCDPEPLQVGRGDNGKGAVPQAWIDQLVILLDADARIVKGQGGWRVDRSGGGAGRAFLYQWERLDAAANEAIRRGIAQALPATPGGGVVRLALTDAFRERRAADRGVQVDAVVVYRAPLAEKPGANRLEVARIEQGMAKCYPLDSGESGARWVNLERLEPVTD